MLALGVIFGFLSAATQSVAYLFSRTYATHVSGGMVRLLVMSHVFQGVVCLPLIWVLLPDDLPPWQRWIVPMISTAGCYLVGQMGLFFALKRTTASRVSPLLGLKVAILAVLTVTLVGDPMSGLQWVAVGVAVAAAFVLNYTGGAMPWPAALAVLFACTGYAFCDVSIRLLIDAMEPVPRLHASLFGLVLVYAVCGLVLAPMLPWYGSRRAGPWIAVMPYAWLWLVSMGFLYACFAVAGIVLGNILQSTRGLMSILLAPLVAARGLVHIEAHVPRSVFWRRVGAGVMMCAAIVLYLYG